MKCPAWLVVMLLFALAAPLPARAAEITATWTGGDGVWSDPSEWSFDIPPTTATHPDNDGTDAFQVAIDGGNSVVSSNVALDASVLVDRVEVDGGMRSPWGREPCSRSRPFPPPARGPW